MNFGILRKSLREMLLPTAVCSFAFFFFQLIFPRVFDQMGSQLMGQLSQVPFVRVVVEAMIGTEIDQLGPKAFQVMAWVHPVILILTWSHAITVCSALPAGEIDNGTADILLTLPVSRMSHSLNASMAWLIHGLILFGVGLAGHIFGQSALPGPPALPLGSVSQVATNLFALYLVAGTLTLFISALSASRSRTIGMSLAIVLASFFLNFIAQFWDPAKGIAFLSILDYYKPMQIVRQASGPMRDIAILGGLSAVFWVGHLLAFWRRDISTI